MAKNPLTGEQRRAKLLEAGARLSALNGAANVTRRMVAKKAGVSEALVSSYFGTTEEAQKLYRKHMKKLGLVEPDKAKIAQIGTKLRAHKKNDKRDARPRSVREIKAIKDKPKSVIIKGKTPFVVAKKAVLAKKSVTPIVAPPLDANASAPVVVKQTAARKPKAPPTKPQPDYTLAS